ncbi:hypothetical protein QFC24_005513 [Naganishia onofrii]|uniref:Uncharacterized protein n=1 Tax=Naganishia onofrii TaxID=1851511 RepID=A0ACC2X6W7_9TREE|nr:hypothetical protein QFC24_005513 [Naganishia onofrii]
MSRLSPAVSGTGTPPIPPPIDQYRTIPTVLKRPLLRFTAETPNPQQEPITVQSLLQLSSTSYTSRLSGKNILLVDPEPVGAAKIEQERRDNALARGHKRVSADASALQLNKEKEQGRRKRRRKVGVMAREEGKMRGIWEIPRHKEISYNLLLPLHYMYLSYLSEMLPLPPFPANGTSQPAAVTRTTPAGPPLLPNARLPNGLGCEQVSSRIVKADFTGAIIRVKKAKNPSLVGHSGIVIQETAETFKLVTPANVVKVIPKQNALFTLSIPAYSFATLPHSPSSLLPSIAMVPTPKTTATATSTPPPPPPPPPTTDPTRFMQTLLSVPKIELDILGSSFTFRAEDRAGRKYKPGSAGGGWGEEWVGLEALGLGMGMEDEAMRRLRFLDRIIHSCRRPSAIRPFPAQPRGVVIPPPSDAVGRGAAAGRLVVLALCFAGQRPVVRTSKTPCRFLVKQVALIRRDLWKKDCSKPTIYQLDQQDVRQVYVLKDFGEMWWKGGIVEVVWTRGWILVWSDLVCLERRNAALWRIGRQATTPFVIDQESMDRIRFDNTYYRTADRHHEQYGQLNGRIIEAGNYEGDKEGRKE